VGGTVARLNRWESLALGAGINSRGVIQVIIAVVGVRLGLLTTAMYSIIVLIAILTPLMAPPILRIAMRRIESTADEELREQRMLALQGVSDGDLPREPQGVSAASNGHPPANGPAHDGTRTADRASVGSVE
ncbi:MAG TPA: hypothetical protein VGL02_27085, partial [Streptomyces sp.]